VFHSCFSSPKNDVLVKFLSGLDRDEDSETTSSEQTNDIEFQESNKTMQSDSHQENFQKVNKTKPELFDEQEDSLDICNLAIMSEHDQGYMNFLVDMHKKMNELITAISFENVPITEEIEQEQQTLTKEVGLYVHQEEMMFRDLYDPMAYYMEISNNQDLRCKTDCKLKGGDIDKST
jgi:hypothetical protein